LKQPNLEFELFAPVAIVTGLSIAALIVLMIVSAGRVDANAAGRERALIVNGVRERLLEVEHAAAAGAAGQAGGFTLDGQASPASAYPRFDAGFRPLIEAVRAEEAPPQATQIAAVGPDVYVLTASRGRPDAPPALAARRLGPEFLAGLSHRYMLDDLQMKPGAAEAPEGMTAAQLRSRDDTPVATLMWTPAAPGRQLYTSAILPILLVVCSIAGIAFMTFGRGRRVAQGLVASEARAKHMAVHDALTTLPNRVLFTDRLSHALEQLRRKPGAVAVFCIDLDRFKEVNDTFGHHCGDDLLREAARRLSATVRTSDTLARLGGDEFAIVQTDATPVAAAALARRINLAMAAPVELSVGRLFIGCSVGITLVDNADVSPVESLRQADLALYRAKDAGRGQYSFFEPEMDAALRMRRAVEADLREALQNGGLEMVYQSQVDAEGRHVGVEALVRWNHPTRGAVSPSFFVPIAEECGLIDRLGAFTLKTAFADSLRWPDHVKVAVNVSASQLRLQGFIATVRRLLQETGADPRRFELEITESVFLGENPKVHETLRQLRDVGFTLALDDFGTGYSSLSYLRRYPVDKIKIDRSFTAALGADQESDAVVGAIIKLARALNLSVVAEGVETADQRHRLAAAGCMDVQGFLFSRPMHAAAMDQLLVGEAVA
jgi:diguanylate cyclase (GGDEF)-like protein